MSRPARPAGAPDGAKDTHPTGAVACAGWLHESSMDAIGEFNWLLPIAGHIEDVSNSFTCAWTPSRAQMTHQLGQLRSRDVEFGWPPNRVPSTRPNAHSGPSQSSAIILLLVATATLVILAAWLVPIQLVLPSISIAALGLAGLGALVAWIWKRTEDKGRLNLWDAAGVLALIGFGSGMLSEPQAVMQLLVGRDS